jgi:hypothetical protein
MNISKLKNKSFYYFVKNSEKDDVKNNSKNVLYSKINSIIQTNSAMYKNIIKKRKDVDLIGLPDKINYIINEI